MVVMSETSERAISDGQMKKLHHILRSRQTRRWLMRRASIRLSIKKLLFKPIGSPWTVLAPLVYSALMKGYMNVLYTTLTPLFTAIFKHITKWHFTPGQAGLTFNTIVVGTVTGSLAGFIFLRFERIALFKRLRREGLLTLSPYISLDFIASSLLSPYIPLAFVASSLLASGGLIAFGTTVKEAQTISTLAVTTLATTGTTLGVLIAEAFIYCVGKGPIADTTDAINFLGALAGGLFPLIAQALYLLPSGIVWTNIISGVAALFIVERVWCWYRHRAKDRSYLLPPRSPRLEGNTMLDFVELGASRD